MSMENSTDGTSRVTGNRKTKVRGGHRAHLTKLFGEITMKLGDVELHKDSILMLRACLERKADTLRKLDEEILEEIDDDVQLLGEIEGAEKIQNTIQEHLMEIDKAVKPQSEVKPAVHSGEKKANIKMPKFECGDFHGDPKKWIAFRDSFDVAVSQKDLSNVEKFHYLRGYLKGEALRAIDGLAVTNENYSEAYEILEKRFGNKQVIVNSHMEELCSIEAVEDKDDTKGLQKLYDTVEVNLRSLRALGVDPQQYGTLLVPIIKKSLLNEVVLLLSRKFDSSTELWVLDDLMKELRLEIEARERCCNEKSKEDSGGAYRDRKKRLPHTAETLFGQNSSSSKLKCVYCEKPHYPDKCKVVTDPVQRKAILQEKKRCFGCTKGGHNARDCRSKKTCYLCKGKHHTSICDGSKKDSGEEQPEKKDAALIAEGGGRNDHKENKVSEPPYGTTLLRTALVNVMNTSTGVSVKARIVLDNCSQCTYATKKLQDALGVEASEVETGQATGVFGGGSTEAKNRDVIVVGINKGRSETVFVKAVVVENICSPLHGQAVSVAREHYEHLYGLTLADDPEPGPVEIAMLIGLEFYWNCVSGAVIRGKCGPVAMESKFGYILSGPSKSWSFIANVPSVSTLITTLLTNTRDEGIERQLRNLWDLESIGIGKEVVSVEQERSDIRFVKEDGMYEVGQPWKEDHEILGDNFQMAKKRTIGNIQRLKRTNLKLLQEYKDIMEKQLNDGTLEIVTDDMTAKVGRTYHMPQHLVVREDKETTKVRVVNDCSSSVSGYPSLNDCLKVPAAYYTDLFAVLVQFRTHQIGLVADIEKAFLRIRLREEDRDSQRIIWVKDPFAEELELQVLRFTTVTFGAGPSMWQLGSVIKHHLQKYKKAYPHIVLEIDRSLYADDLSTGGDDDDDAMRMYKEGRKIFKDAGMNLRKWRCNSETVMAVVKDEENMENAGLPQVEDESYASSLLNPKDTSPVKVLGTPWDVEKDVFRISLEKILEKKDDVETKIQLLSVTNSIFDILGLLAPVVFFLKVLFQMVCKVGGSWDDEVSQEVKTNWKRWITGAERFNVFKVPRCYHERIKKGDVNVMLVGFSDASKKGYAAVLYIRVQDREGEVTVNLVASKTRVAPIEEQSIPRLELLGALILARLFARVRGILEKTVKIEKEHCFSDSAVALHLIKNDNKQYKPYVEARASETRSKVPAKKWRHLAGSDNIADLPSRGCTPDQLERRKEEWFHAPEWVKKDESAWLVREVEDLSLSEAQRSSIAKEEKKSAEKPKEVVMVAKSVRNLEEVIDPTRFSTMTKLLRVTVLCQKFIELVKEKGRTFKSHHIGDVSAEDITRAKELWIKHLQQQVKTEAKFEKSAGALGVKEVDGYLRCMGRLGRSKLPFETKYPLLLLTYHWVTTLIIKSCHETVYHDGVKETLAEFRSNYWLTKGRQRVKAVLRKCHLCKLLEGLAYPAPVTADLPEFRLDGGTAFKYTAVDFCGPVYVKEVNDKCVKMRKAYILVLRCATSRMVHLELCPDLTTEAYIRSQQRFMGRRGTPVMFVSDNGRTFKGKALRAFNAERGIRWRFNLAKAPWWGGLFERMVRSTKRCLRKAIGSRRLTYEELNTVLIEVEAVLNSRPITYVYENDFEEPLTPCHLFCGRRLLSKAQNAEDEDIPEDESFEDKRKDVVRKVKNESAVIDHFWKRWHKEYLGDLRESQKMHQQKDKPSIAVGEVVLVEEEGRKRNEWKLGRIEELVVGKDGVIRGAKVKTSTVKGAKGMISRPLQKLYPLEIRDDQTWSHKDDAAENTDGPSAVPMTLDTLPSQLSPNSKTDSMSSGIENLSQKMSNSPPPSTSEELPKPSIVQKTSGSISTTRPKRKVGMLGETKRRMVERR